MSESQLWTLLRGHLGRRVGEQWERIENAVGAGTPDVYYCLHGHSGWIELKEIRRLPPRASSVILQHFTREQRLWLKYHVHCGGHAWLLLRIAERKELYLFPGDWAAMNVGFVPWRVLRNKAVLYWPYGAGYGRIGAAPFVQKLRQTLIGSDV